MNLSRLTWPKSLLLTAKFLGVAIASAAAIVACRAPKAVTLPAAKGTENVFPAMSVQNLSGKELALPSQFPGKKTLLLVAYEREQQTALDDWSARMKLREPGAPEWLELPVITDPGAMMRTVIDNGMRGGIPDPAIRDRVYTIYTPREEFNKRVGISDLKSVHLLVADRSGKILARVSGDWSADKEKTLRSALSGR
jgi:hypothetical protein